jgi:hypothetical protein
MFKKTRDKLTAGARQSSAPVHGVMPQLPTLDQVSQAYQAMHEDPAMAAYLKLPVDEQLRQQRQVNAYGRNLNRLHESGEPATVVILGLEPTGKTVAGQREYTSALDVTRADGTVYRTTITHLVPAMVFSQYTPGTRHKAKIDPTDPAKVGVFELIA